MATEITELIQIPPNKKVIIDFYATWCGPCARVTPIIDDLAEKYENIVFLKVNVDEADEIAAGFEISQLPTFIYLNMGNIVQRIEGANLSDILSCIEKLDRVVNKEPEIRNKEVKDSEIPQTKENRKESRREESKREEPKREEQKIEKRIDRDVKREEPKDERSLRKKIEARVQLESEAMPPKKIEMKISKSKETEKKKSKKQSSKESQKKAERRVFNDVNPYEIEYNNDTPKISTDDSNSNDSDSDSDKISSLDSISS